MIVYDPFWNTLEKKGVSTYALITRYNISSSTISRLKNNKPVTTTTLNDLCRILQCSVSEILQYVDVENQ
ncbi:helix-turn-helix transcriptional regulator [Anaerovorax odorimutans]|uniref:Helix-turn-helix transcriptional regulator n=1 Tax=Anaerovorax odorimutans TaxID=109327 RepID=A0ABT1RKX9_9FIRM|nr:helix-turn-helix transcriptional regulator [Anaerovorax odorimutans]MCQ4635834.1 helix-turn-helix transcriptional regulator [Anaerovorax odorimutans]